MSLALPSNEVVVVDNRSKKEKCREAGDLLIQFLTQENRELMRGVIRQLSKVHAYCENYNTNFNSDVTYFVHKEERIPTKQCLELLKALRDQNYPTQKPFDDAINVLRDVMVQGGFLIMPNCEPLAYAETLAGRPHLTDMLSQVILASHAPNFGYAQKTQIGLRFPSPWIEYEAADPIEARLLDLEYKESERKVRRVENRFRLVNREELQRRARERQRRLREGIPLEEYAVKETPPPPRRPPFHVKMAVKYLNHFILTVGGKQKIYNDFCDILKRYEDRLVLFGDAMKEMMVLLYDHPKLLEDLDIFLPNEYQINECKHGGYVMVTPFTRYVYRSPADQKKMEEAQQ